MEKYYKIAGLTVKMDSFGKTVKQAEPYLCQQCESVDIQISSAWQRWKAEYPQLSDEVCEYMSTGTNFYFHLILHGGLMLHSSAVVVDGKAYLFTADSGTGKSTHANLWLERFGDRAYILNDDKPALRLEEGVWYAYGTPWSGKTNLSKNVRVPVAGIAVLERGEQNEIAPYSGIGAVHAILRQVNRPKYPEHRIKLMELVDKLITQIPVWKLRCNKEPEAVQVSYEAMSGQKITEKGE